MEQKKRKKKFEMPDTYVIIFSILVLAAILTYILPAGVFDRVQDVATGRMVVVPGTYHRVENTPISITDFFLAIPQGMIKNAGIIFFVLIIGGCFGIVNASGSFEALIRCTITKQKGRKGKGGEYIVALLVCLFGLAGGVVGMSIECLAFVPILITLCLSLGFDSVVAVAIMLIGVSYGYGCAPINPFTVGLAQSIVGLPMFSGMSYRWLLFAVSSVVVGIYLIIYCRKIKADPSKSLVAGMDFSEFELAEIEDAKLTKRQIGVLVTFFGGIVVLMVMIIKKGWYMTELSAFFFALTILCGIVYGMSVNELSRNFLQGVKDMAYAGMLIGLAASISIVMESGQILDTVVYAFSLPLQHTPTVLNGGLMMIVQTCINFFITSGSGQCVVTMPLMAPLADLVGVSRQTAVLAYQLGDGCSNAIIPTSAMLMAAIAIGKIPFTRWVKFVWKWLVIQYVIGFIFCVVATIIGYGPF